MNKFITLNNIDTAILQALEPSGYKLSDIECIHINLYIGKTVIPVVIRKEVIVNG